MGPDNNIPLSGCTMVYWSIHFLKDIATAFFFFFSYLENGDNDTITFYIMKLLLGLSKRI